jgi:hypothetical protein
MAIFGKIQTSNDRQKTFATPITLALDEIFTKGFLSLKRGTLEMRNAVSREQIAQRARTLLAHTYVINLFLYAFSYKYSCAYIYFGVAVLNLVLNLVVESQL